MTAQAFSKARQNISVEGFYDLFLESTRFSDLEIIEEQRDENSKYKYQTNCRNLIGIIARKILQLLYSDKKIVFMNIIKLAIKKRSCIRPDRKHKRNSRAHKGDVYCHTLKTSI